MMAHHDDPGVFVRSMATRGAAGGMAPATLEVALLMAAAGRDIVLIETVGTGQDEVDIALVADVTVLVLVPGLGDEIQATKAGVIEGADVFAINKADRTGVEQLESELKSSLGLSQSAGGPPPRIVRTVATEGQGVDELLANIRAAYSDRGGEKKKQEIWGRRLAQMWRERVLARFPVPGQSQAAADVAARRRDPYSVIQEWAERFGLDKFPRADD